MKAVFLRVIEARVDEKAQVLRAAVDSAAAGVRFEVELDDFLAVPKAPFSYWVDERLRRTFSEFPAFNNDQRVATVGLQSSNDFRFLRAWFEVCPGGPYVPFAKGGPHAPYYSDLPLCVLWGESGDEIKAYAETTPGSKHWSRNIRSASLYFRPGLTWPIKNRFTLKPWPLPGGCAFSHVGPSAFVEGDEHERLLALHALMSSSLFTILVRIMAGWNFEAGVVQRVPVPDLQHSDEIPLSSLARRAWSLKRALDTRVETSHAFFLPALLQAKGDALQARAQAWADLSANRQQEVAEIQSEIDDRCFALYGIGPKDRRSIEAGFGPTEASDEDDEDNDEDDSSDDEVDAGPMVASLLSWTLGVAFGRFDLRLATGARPLPPEPDPFAPLPVCSPGMLTGDDGLPLPAPPSGHPLSFPTDGILVDDPGHPRDLVKAVRAVFDEVFDDANARWHEAAEQVGARGGDLRDWFARSFIGEHIKRYSKSRRKAPIYWQLATSSASYSVWVYIHRATPDTLFRVLNDFVSPKLDHEREKLDRMTRDAGPNPSRTDRDALAAQETFVAELQALRAEVARVAPLWKPDLDDGVILTFAPLWRLVPQERSWQTECRKAWDKLCAREYDWAHLAMHLWPEEVVPKCAKDRSLAIAHGLEEALWSEDDAGNWHPADVPDATLRTLIADRTSASVKAALKDLLSAPAPAGKAKGRRGRGTPRRASTARRAAPSSSTPTPSSAASMDEATLTAVRAAIAAVADGASKADVLAATSLSDGDWNRAIAALLDRGDVTRTGQKRGTRYHAVRGGHR